MALFQLTEVPIVKVSIQYKMLNEYKKGWDQFLPFLVTVISILLTDLLVGIGIGMVIGLFFVIKTNFHRAILVTERKGNYLVKLQKDVSFLNKAPLIKELSQIPEGSNGVNFGISLSLWDYIFKTDYIPSSGKDIELGFHNDSEYPDTFSQQVLNPFKKNI